MFPIKYIDNNLVWNKDNEVFAYYELIPYNYSFLSAEQKFIVHDSFRQLIAQSREGNPLSHIILAIIPTNSCQMMSNPRCRPALQAPYSQCARQTAPPDKSRVQR